MRVELKRLLTALETHRAALGQPPIGNPFLRDLMPSNDEGKIEFTKQELRDLLGHTVHSNFSDLDLSGVDLSDLNLRGFMFVRTNLRGANFRGAKFELTMFHNADLTGAILSDEQRAYAKAQDATVDSPPTA